MVSPLGSLPIASPLQNPVLTGYGNLFGALYSPLQQMAAPLSTLAYAEMLSGKNDYFNAIANVKNADVAAGVPQSVAQKNYGDAASSNANAGYRGQKAANEGAPVTINPYNVAPQTPNYGAPANTAQPAPIMAPTPTIQGPNSSALSTVQQPVQQVMTPQQQSQMQSLQQQLQPTKNALQEGQIQPAGQFDVSQINNPGYYDTYFTQNPNATPPTLPSRGAVQNPPQFIQTKVNSYPQFLDGIDSITKYASNPQVQAYMGNSVRAMSMRAQGAVLAKEGKAPQGYKDYLVMQQNSINTGESAAKALTGSIGVRPMQLMINTLDSSKYPDASTYNQAVMGLVQKAKQDAIGMYNQNYMPAFRNQAFNSIGRIVNSDTYQSYLKSQRPQVSPTSSSQAPQLAPSYNYNGKTYSAAQIQQAAQQGGISPQVLVQRMQRMGGG